jgi:hypothetical protein
MRYGDNRLGTFEPDRLRVSSPFRAKRLFSTNPGLSYFGHFGPRIGNVQTLGDDIVGRARRGKPRFGRSLTLPAPNASICEICAVVDQDLHQVGGTLID